MNDYRCKLCGRKLKNWKSIQQGMGPTCENKYLDKLYASQQIILDFLIKDKS